MSQGGSAGTGSQGKPAAGNGGVGVPDDAVSAFAKAITDAGKAALKEETGDPNVSVAFQLGWTIEIITNSPGDDTVKTLPGLDARRHVPEDPRRARLRCAHEAHGRCH